MKALHLRSRQSVEKLKRFFAVTNGVKVCFNEYMLKDRLMAYIFQWLNNSNKQQWYSTNWFSATMEK